MWRINCCQSHVSSVESCIQPSPYLGKEFLLPKQGEQEGSRAKSELQRKLIKPILIQIVKDLSLFIFHHVPQVILIWTKFENHIILFRLLGSYLNVQGHLGSQGQGYAWLKPPGYQLSIVRCPQRSKRQEWLLNARPVQSNRNVLQATYVLEVFRVDTLKKCEKQVSWILTTYFI